MAGAYVNGAGQSRAGSYPEGSYLLLFETAFDNAVESVDGDLDPDRIDEAFPGTLGSGGSQIGLSPPAVTEHLGVHGLPTTRVENACAAGGHAPGAAATGSGPSSVASPSRRASPATA